MYKSKGKVHLHVNLHVLLIVERRLGSSAETVELGVGTLTRSEASVHLVN
jgi:hypothetical protein